MRSEPHPSAIFSIVPCGDRRTYNQSIGILLCHENLPHVSHIPNVLQIREYGINIGPHIGSKLPGALATLGREGDIIIPEQDTSSTQCSFGLDPVTNDVFIYDQSSKQNMRVYGRNVSGFKQYFAIRRTVISRETNFGFQFEGPNNTLYDFKIVWHVEQAKMQSTMQNPRIEDQPALIRWEEIEPIGKGAFGRVLKVMNIDDGSHIAVKIIKLPEQQDFTKLEQEAYLLARAAHPNVVPYIGHQTTKTKFEMFTALREGSVRDLMRKGVFEKQKHLLPQLLRQMLLALYHLEKVNIVHRDIKPENILYMRLPNGDFTFQLADFGWSKLAPDAKTSHAGTGWYRAPEMYPDPSRKRVKNPYTNSVDIWSLFVTIVEAYNIYGFQEKLRTCNTFQRMELIANIATVPELEGIKKMAEPKPSNRATAAEMLDALFPEWRERRYGQE